MTAEWSPNVPKHLTKRDWREYRAGRNAMFAEAGRLLGGRVLCLEV